MTTTEPATPDDRWGRLAASLAEAGITARLDARPYTEAVRGRVVSGVTKSITVKRPAGGLVVVHDKWSRGDTWLGWEVYAEGADSIEVGRASRWTKKRSEVVAAVAKRI